MKLCPQRISPDDLAAFNYPEGDVRNQPAVRQALQETQARLARLPLLANLNIENFEQRAERLFWEDWALALQKRLGRRSNQASYSLSSATRHLLLTALQAVQDDVDGWRS